MERVLAEALRDQRSLGRQSDGAWKAVAYNAATDALSARFNVQLIGDNVINHIKLWQGWYEIVSDILSQSGFDRDAPKCMINVEDENAWNEYVKFMFYFWAHELVIGV
ncbi:Myb/SANT-like DNA-binding domain protein [Medicago truncatula]|uniref:Myb/SANT-like DNA-binding domain protein n=1 Tax=Medicago truncatula TaxID=3880 RepID=G7L4K3_MEDTR|nr:Myb/SANT-like DNA-binding domain protein [Medicago truncatula]